MKFSSNTKCPCGSNQKYKNCCEIYHNGVKAANALVLMKTRYSAYAVCNADYIIKTTHPSNPSARADKAIALKEINAFCKATQFIGLDILEFIDGENEAFVSFRAKFSNYEMVEKSRFLKQDNIWLYLDGEFLER